MARVIPRSSLENHCERQTGGLGAFWAAKGIGHDRNLYPVRSRDLILVYVLRFWYLVVRKC